MRLVSVVLWILLIPPLRAQDFQQWNEVDLTASWHKVELLAPFLARTDTKLPNPQLAATGIEADFPLPWHLTLAGGYLLADLPQRSLLVDLPLVALMKTFPVEEFTIAGRNRFEKLVGFGNSPVRYRNRLLVDRPLGARKRWHLFADDEVFFDLSAGAWNQNRAQAGGGVWISRGLWLDVYYLHRNASGPSPTTRMLGTTLRVALGPESEEVEP